MRKYLSDTREMTGKKNYKTALTRFEWYYKHAVEKCRRVEASRLSFALLYWKELADVYPPALAAMKKTRDSTMYLFILGAGDITAFSEAKALNRTLGEQEKTLALFERLDTLDHQLAKACWIVARDLLFENKKFDLISKYLEDPNEEYRSALDFYKMDKSGNRGVAIMDSMSNEFFVTDCINLIDYCLYIRDTTKAKVIQQKAIKVLDDKRLRDAI